MNLVRDAIRKRSVILNLRIILKKDIIKTQKCNVFSEYSE